MALAAIPFVGWIGTAISTLMAFAITKAFIAIGVFYITLQGVDVLYDNAEAKIRTLFSGLPADIFSIVTMCGAGEAITILISAFTARLVLMGFVNGAKAFLAIRPTG